MKFNLIHLILLVVLVYFIKCACSKKVREGMESMTEENCAPLNEATFENNYPVGKCNTDFKRTDCMVGNCPLKSTIDNDEYCNIQCAQELDPKLRNECVSHCLEMMNEYR